MFACDRNSRGWGGVAGPDELADPWSAGSEALESAVRELADFLASPAAIKASRLPPNLVRVLVAAGVRASAARAAGAIGLALPMTGRSRHGAPKPFPGMPTVRRVATGEPAWRARFIVASALRLDAAVKERGLAAAVKLERWYAHLHLLAGRKRKAAAARLDAAGSRSANGWMVWRTMMDSRTTPTCAALNGRLFHISDPPGLPGAIHSRCRCSAEPWQ